MTNAERDKHSPVVYWSSEWKNGKLVFGEINKESSYYKKSVAKKAAEEIWKGKKMYELYSKTEKIYMFICGLIIALGIVYITHLYFEYRVVHNEWLQIFTTPKEFWASVPEWKWKRIF